MGTQLFIQMGCTYTDDELKTRQIYGLFIGCITVSCALFVKVFSDYLEQRAWNEYKLWDVKTLTASDYTVEFPIS